jgi:hypothetical protein
MARRDGDPEKTTLPICVQIAGVFLLHLIANSFHWPTCTFLLLNQYEERCALLESETRSAATFYQSKQREWLVRNDPSQDL